MYTASEVIPSRNIAYILPLTINWHDKVSGTFMYAETSNNFIKLIR